MHFAYTQPCRDLHHIYLYSHHVLQDTIVVMSDKLTMDLKWALLIYTDCRWDIVHDTGSLGWHMAVKATQDISAGSPLALSYGHRPSDDFFLHYGFVPSMSCPHEVRRCRASRIYIETKNIGNT